MPRSSPENSVATDPFFANKKGVTFGRLLTIDDMNIS